MFKFKTWELSLTIANSNTFVTVIQKFFSKNFIKILFAFLVSISIISYVIFYINGLGLSYNDARSHLDIGRRVVEGLKPGFAQIGSVWLPLPHLLMIPTIWNDFMWHSGLSGAIQSMLSFVATGFIIYLFLKELGVRMLGRLVGVGIFIANINILYLQSTAMTELLLIATMMAGIYQLLIWFKNDSPLHFVQAAFWIMLSTLIRYDGWFLFIVATVLIAMHVVKRKGFKAAEGTVLYFVTLAGFGIGLWFVWNLLIFKDPLYFIYGPYSAHAQQEQLAAAGVLATEGDLLFSIKTYFYALAYNSNAFIFLMGMFGAILFWLDKKVKTSVKIGVLALFAPLVFNILALYMGQSVLFIQGLSGDTWFNARYGIMMMPTFAIFIGYLVHKLEKMNLVIIGLLAFVLFFSFASYDAVTIDDARVGSSQKNVSEVSGWLMEHAKNEKGFVLISAASHDAIIFSSGLPMGKFIHEGTGTYWENATTSPDRWARWIIMRTNDDNDQTFKAVKSTTGFKNYNLKKSYPFADIYELKPEFVKDVITDPILPKQQ